MGHPDPGMGRPEDPRQPLSHSPCPPQHSVPAFTVPQPDGPLAVLRERAEQISVSPPGPQFAYLCREGQLLIQLAHILVLGAGVGGEG